VLVLEEKERLQGEKRKPVPTYGEGEGKESG
jgi:hypothetical protein